MYLVTYQHKSLSYFLNYSRRYRRFVILWGLFDPSQDRQATHHWKDVVELGEGLVRIGPGSEDGWQSVEEAGEDQSPLPHWGRMMNSYR